MHTPPQSVPIALDNFKLSGKMICYSSFMPRLYNLCRSLGFRSGQILPSRAFCSDESQGYPIILIAKHFGTFPFNHGRVGGIVSNDRHGPHAEHGQDLLILQASHVGYDPDTKKFGEYCRLHTEHGEKTSNCGKIAGTLAWYQAEYTFARKHIQLVRQDAQLLVVISNELFNPYRTEGLFLNLNRIISLQEDGTPRPVKSFSAANAYLASDELRQRVMFDTNDRIEAVSDTPVSIGSLLTPQLFYFKRDLSDIVEGRNHLERNLLTPMPWIVTSPHPMLTAAQINTQAEFDRNYHRILRSPAYRGRNLIFLAGLNIDISPHCGQAFPLTKYVPWAAYIQREDGSRQVLEQDAIWQRLLDQPEDNPDEVDLDEAIRAMGTGADVKVTT